MKLTYLFIAVLTSLTFVQCTHTKLIIKTDDGKEKIKDDMSIAVDKKGKKINFNDDCKSICKNCSPVLQNTRISVDSIMGSYIVLRRDLEFMFDTIPQSQFKMRSKRDKKTNLEIVLSIDRRPFYVYKIPTKSERERINYDDIQRIIYSYKDKCYRGGPFQKLFSNPNKIRRLNMENGYEHKIKYH